MASTWKQSITTSAGIALMNKAYGVSSIIPTKAVTITDDISGYSVTQLMALTSVNYNQSRVPIVVSNQANTTRIGIDIDNKDVNEQYDYYGIGVYFKQVNTGEEVLFSVIPLTGAATIIPNQSGVATSSISIDSYTSIVPGTKVDLSVSESGSVTRSDVEQIVAANQSYSFPKKPVASGIDFYTLKSVGIYQIKDDKKVVNAPDGFSGNGYVIVIGDGTTANPITQDLFDTVTGNKYSNSYDSDGNKWTGWEEMASKSDVTTTLNNGLSTKVTDNKNGTITVNGASIFPANENVIGRIDGAYTDMNDVPMGWWYLNGWTGVSGLANWGLPQGFYYVHCFKTRVWNSANIQIAYNVSLNSTYVRTMSGTNWKTWKLLADDSTVVHTADMRKPASDVAGIEEVNTKQDKIGYTPADDSKVVHTADTSSWQKQKITNDDGSTIKTLSNPSSDNLNTYLNSLSMGVKTIVCIAGVPGNPSATNVKGIFQVTSYNTSNKWNFGSGYLIDSNNNIWSVVTNAGIVNYALLASDSKVVHLSGANNFDTVPTVNNNPLLLASSLPSDLARTGQDANFTGKLQKSGVDVATVDDVSAKQDKLDYTPANAANVVDRNPDTGVVSTPTDFTKLTVNGGKSVATAADLKSLEASAWRQLDNQYVSADGYAVSPDTVILYKIEEDSKRLYLQGTIKMIDNNSSIPTVSIALTSIVKTILTVSGGYLGFPDGYVSSDGYIYHNFLMSAEGITLKTNSVGIAVILYSPYITYDELI